MKKYDGKRAVIIGGTSGMGLATAKMLLEEGARVLVTGRSQAGLESAEQELGGSAIVVSSDARSLTDIDALATRVKGEFGTFDLLFVNAGFSIPTPLDSVTEAIYDEMFNLNAKGPFFLGPEARPVDQSGRLSCPDDLRRQRQGTAGPSHIRGRQGCAAVVRPSARHRAASAGNPR
ncbi:SDR family NAD(P)-dependent oxidoreductase [Burkholderia plantarii]|nr:SDR family NAD(P)-dependent oxidoreductase [Burkholderia plantarii]